MDTKALKQKILDLAIRGKLVPQDPNDEPASVLLEKIRAEKQQMVKDGMLKSKDLKNDTVIFVGEDNLHYEKFSDGTIKCIEKELKALKINIPKSWNWVRLGHIFMHNTGKALNSANQSGELLEYITTSNLYWNRFELQTLKKMYFTANEIDKCTVKKGDLLVCEGGDIGRAAIWNYDYDIRIQNHIHKLRPYVFVCTEFFYYLFYSYKNAGLIGGKGIGLQGLSSNALHSLLFPIPPVQEQLRITSAINSLFSNIDSINADGDELKALVNTTKSKILDLAIRGKLVPQDPNDEPASVLLERIRKEKEELIKAGKLKRDKRESIIFRGEDNSYYETIGNKRACIDSEIHYDIPEGWTVERLKNLYSVNPKNDIANDETIVSFVPMNLINEQFLYNGTYELKQWKDCKKGFTHFADGDLGFAKISPCFENRKSVVFSNLKNGYGAGTTELYILRNFCEGLNPEYAILFLKSESFIERGVDTYSGTVGQQRIDKNIMMDTIIPIPPQNEQQRIADRVKQLFSILDSIQATIV